MESCVGCGATLAPTWKFCIHCGIAVDAHEIPAAIRPDDPVEAPTPSRIGDILLLVGGIVAFLVGAGSIGIAIAFAVGALK
jgi:hypothetical protein